MFDKKCSCCLVLRALNSTSERASSLSDTELTVPKSFWKSSRLNGSDEDRPSVC